MHLIQVKMDRNASCVLKKKHKKSQTYSTLSFAMT